MISRVLVLAFLCCAATGTSYSNSDDHKKLADDWIDAPLNPRFEQLRRDLLLEKRQNQLKDVDTLTTMGLSVVAGIAFVVHPAAGVVVLVATELFAHEKIKPTLLEHVGIVSLALITRHVGNNVKEKFRNK